MFGRKAAHIKRLEFAYSATLEDLWQAHDLISDLRRRLQYYQNQHPVVEAEFIFIEAVNHKPRN